MDNTKKEFVFATRDIKVSDLISVEKNDVGILVGSNDKDSEVFFIRLWQEVTINNEDYQTFDVVETGDAFPKKICNVCHKIYKTSEFDKNQNGINNRTVRRPSCKTCRKILDGMNIPAKAKEAWLSKKPSYTPFECPICRKRTIAGVTSKVVLDHNHRTGEPREWICDSCNTGIGRFKDDAAILQRAIKFLE
jgi:hypothetical protein